MTVIAALAAFDIVYVSTGGGPGHRDRGPGLQIYILAFLERQVGLASALAVVLIVLVLVVVLPDPAAHARGRAMMSAGASCTPGGAAHRALIAITILPFVSIFTTALHPSGTVPVGLSWPADPQWGNFLRGLHRSPTWARS